MTTTRDPEISGLRSLARRFNSTVRHTEVCTEARPNKRRRISHFFGQNLWPASSDEHHQTSDSWRRKSVGLFSLFSLQKFRDSAPVQHTLDDSTTSVEQKARTDQVSAHTLGPVHAPEAPREPEHRRSSIAKIKDFLSRKRKDSGTADASGSRTVFRWLRPNTNRRVDNEMQYYNATLEPLALGKYYGTTEFSQLTAVQ